jgi:hypothetical protein
MKMGPSKITVRNPILDASLISDAGSFTGAFDGMFAMDMTGLGHEARLDHLNYRPEGT